MCLGEVQSQCGCWECSRGRDIGEGTADRLFLRASTYVTINRDRSVITVKGSVYKHHACERKFCTCFRVLNEEKMCLLLVSLCGVRFHTADTL